MDADQDMERFWSLVARVECQSCTRRKPWTEARPLTALEPWDENFIDCSIVKSEIFIYLISWGANKIDLRSYAIGGQADRTAKVAQLTNSGAGHLHIQSENVGRCKTKQARFFYSPKYYWA